MGRVENTPQCAQSSHDPLSLLVEADFSQLVNHQSTFILAEKRKQNKDLVLTFVHILEGGSFAGIGDIYFGLHLAKEETGVIFLVSVSKKCIENFHG